MPEEVRITRIEGSPVEYVNIHAFGRDFRGLFPENTESIITLEKEGALYERLFDEKHERVNYYRLRLLPHEIVRYVDGITAQQEYFEAYEKYQGDKDKALASVKNRKIAEEVELWRRAPLRNGQVEDMRGCEASFLGKELEGLICMRSHPERLELLPEVNSRDKLAVILGVFDSISTGISFLSKRNHGRPPYVVENEYDLQDLLYVILKPFFADARLEEYTPKHAGGAKRIDIVIPSIETVVETKYVRDERHAVSVADEIKVDIESYHVHPSCKTLCVLVYDSRMMIKDPINVAIDLSGLRIIGGKSFETKVVIKN